MSVIRDINMRPRWPGLPILRAVVLQSRDTPVERVDLYLDRYGTAQTGVAWADGSTTIFSWRSAEQARQWLGEQAWATGKVREHRQ